jgi:hypothetical protein
MKQIKFLSRARQLQLTILLAGMCLTAVAKAQTPVNLQEDWGIEPVHIRVTAGGYMIEFRYRIIDAEKALILSDRKDFPHLQALKSKARLNVPYGPTVGFLKSNRKFVKPGKNYTTMFNNQGQHLIAGDLVQIEIRDQVSPKLTLE